MTKKKPPPEKPRPKTDDAEWAHAEASALLGLGGDPSKLCGADRVRVGMVAGLMAAVDAATESLLAGNSSAGDIGRLTSSVDALIRLLPKAATEAPSRADPRKALLEMILQMRDRDEIADRAEEPTLRERIVALEAALAAKDAELAALRAGAPSPGSPPAPAGGNVVPLPRGAPAWAAPAPAAPAYDYDANTEWKSYVNSDASIRSTPRGGGHDWGPV